MAARRLLLDQMIDMDIAADLRAAGHDVGCVGDVGMARADDEDILEYAIREDRIPILINLDEDFGDWAVLPLDKHPGVIRVKAMPTSTEMILSVLLPFLQTHHADRDFSNCLVIVRSPNTRWIRTGGGSPTE